MRDTENRQTWCSHCQLQLVFIFSGSNHPVSGILLSFPWWLACRATQLFDKHLRSKLHLQNAVRRPLESATASCPGELLFTAKRWVTNTIHSWVQGSPCRGRGLGWESWSCSRHPLTCGWGWEDNLPHASGQLWAPSLPLLFRSDLQSLPTHEMSSDHCWCPLNGAFQKRTVNGNHPPQPSENLRNLAGKPQVSISHVVYQLQGFLRGHTTVDAVHTCVSACVSVCVQSSSG